MTLYRRRAIFSERKTDYLNLKFIGCCWIFTRKCSLLKGYANYFLSNFDDHKIAAMSGNNNLFDIKSEKNMNEENENLICKYLNYGCKVVKFFHDRRESHARA